MLSGHIDAAVAPGLADLRQGGGDHLDKHVFQRVDGHDLTEDLVGSVQLAVF
jgi:hypothetical protein